MNIVETFNAYLAREVAGGEPTSDTRRTYQGQLNLYLRWCEVEHINPESATRTDIERYRDSLKDSGASASTRCLKISVVKSLYEALIWGGYIEHNPATRVRVRRGAQSENTKAFDSSELGSILGNIQGDGISARRDRAAVALLSLHGLRSIELHRLNHDSLDTSGENPFLRIQGKGNKSRLVYLRPDTLAVLLAYIEAKAEAELAVKGAIFLNFSNQGYGTRLSRHGIQMLVNKHLKAVDLKTPGVSCHSLRHSFGSLAIQGGAKIEQLRDAMGHSSVATTSIYVRAFERAEHNPAKFISVEVSA